MAIASRWNSYHQFLHGHHIQHWLHRGETSVDNLVMLCSRHHHLVHEGGFTLTWSTDYDWAISALLRAA
jgi:predicted restriction endonuclease